MCRFRVSYLEIYNEQIRDLLRPETPSSKIQVSNKGGREEWDGNTACIMSGYAMERPKAVCRPARGV